MANRRALITASLDHMNWDWTRTLRAAAIAAWGGFFIYLWASGRATTYIGPKTSWVVALGAITLPAVALAYLWGARGHRRAPSAREFGANTLLVAPILLTLMVPAPSLGALAVENKRTDNVAVPLDTAVEGAITIREIAYAVASPEFAERNELTAGKPVDFVAFVSAARDDKGEIEVARFMVGCCAADANAVAVGVGNAPDVALDTWVHVKGRLIGTPGADLRVQATSVKKVAEPGMPYV
jgi:uncharacterized repeat protein (TIGR03943 family)